MARLRGLAALRSLRPGASLRGAGRRDGEDVRLFRLGAPISRRPDRRGLCAALRRSGESAGAGNHAGPAFAIADPIVAKVISPEALSEFLTAGWPATVLPDVPQDAVGISRKTLGNAWHIFA